MAIQIIKKFKNDVKLRFNDLKKPQNTIIKDIQIIYLYLFAFVQWPR